jgi:hypothetical protein
MLNWISSLKTDPYCFIHGSLQEQNQLYIYIYIYLLIYTFQTLVHNINNIKKSINRQ